MPKHQEPTVWHWLLVSQYRSGYQVSIGWQAFSASSVTPSLTILSQEPTRRTQNRTTNGNHNRFLCSSQPKNLRRAPPLGKPRHLSPQSVNPRFRAKNEQRKTRETQRPASTFWPKQPPTQPVRTWKLWSSSFVIRASSFPHPPLAPRRYDYIGCAGYSLNSAPPRPPITRSELPCTTGPPGGWHRLPRQPVQVNDLRGETQWSAAFCSSPSWPPPSSRALPMPTTPRPNRPTAEPGEAPTPAQDWDRFYHYPYVYYPQNFWGNEYFRSADSLYHRYPPEMRIPVYNRHWHNYYPNRRAYHWGHHFALDVF